MSGPSSLGMKLRVADLALDRSHKVHFEADSDLRAAIARDLQIPGLRKLRLVGSLEPQGKSDWALSATLGATAEQACVVTLEPITTRIDAPVRRLFVADLPTPTAGEDVEMPNDETVEALPEFLDLSAIAAEALALELPAYPRSAAAAEPPETSREAEEEADRILPFAGLKDLMNKS